MKEIALDLSTIGLTNLDSFTVVVTMTGFEEEKRIFFVDGD